MELLDDKLVTRDLLLDPENPRLPEDLVGKSQSAMLEYLVENDVLEEIAESIFLNGFFPNEPLIVLPPDERGARIVVEGNRRLATLQIILQSPDAQEVGAKFDLDFSPTQLAALEEVPAYEVANRRELASYLGFRHINGIRTWGASEKARYVSQQIRDAEKLGEDDPFYVVGRMVGGNARGTRTNYVGYQLLKSAEQEIDNPRSVDYIFRHRFAVWLRVLNAKGASDLLRIDREARSLSEVDRSIKSADYEIVSEVISDLSPGEGGTPPLLADSRDAVDYVSILADSQARRLLRDTRNLTLAKSILNDESLVQRAKELLSQVEALQEQNKDRDTFTSEEFGAVRSLHSAARVLLAMVQISAPEEA
ncbi:hypothetical protein [Curtobacterium sp. MCBA15_008]|uniref:hypothetical protein n=1 Tax=Curtobacterium sp. MCBA15_008 TaxID=1898736 RepID=UPI001113F9D4|nr:hypothetical protein [Curtobacterium sp. MCBA15_008]